MPERTTAEDRLHRLLHVLPAAAREGGAPLASLAAELGVSERDVLRDLHEATDATFHRPAGSVDPYSIAIEAGAAGEVVHVHTTGDFRRPARLTPRESLALVLGLRAMAAEVLPDRKEAVLRLARRMEDELGSTIVQANDDPAPDPAPAAPRPAEGAADVRPDAALDVEPEVVLADAAARRRRCTIRYIKPRGEPEDRTVEPWRLVHSEGHWYVLARDAGAAGMRLFRCDRVLRAAVLDDEVFDVPADFDPSTHLPNGIAFAAPVTERVVVRYAQPAARWVAEAVGEACDDQGSISVAHDVADRTWLVRHVLGFGGTAVVTAPQDVRAEVADRADRIVEVLADAG